MTYHRPNLPLFYLLSEDEWPKSRRGLSFLAVMRDAAQRRFKDPRWRRLASTYRLETSLPVTNTINPADLAEVTRILEWHHPDVYIYRHPANDSDESAPSGVLVRHWTVYDLDEDDWQRARDTEAQCRTRTDVQLREFDALLDGFAKVIVGEKENATFTLAGSERATLPILSTSWDVEIPALRAWHAHGRYRSASGERSPHDGRPIFVDPDSVKAWLGGIAPISFDEPPNLDKAREFLIEFEADLKIAAEARQAREGATEIQMSIPGGTKGFFAILKRPPFNLTRQDYDTLIEEWSSQVFKKRGRPVGSEIIRPILDRLVIKYVGPI